MSYNFFSRKEPTVADALRVARPCLSEAIVPAHQFSLLERVASSVPLFEKQSIHLEARLDAQNERVDLVTSMEKKRASWPSSLPPEFHEYAHWRRARSYHKAWNDPNHLVNDMVKDSWLEFDVTSDEVEAKMPGLLMGLQKKSGSYPPHEEESRRIMHLSRVLSTVVLNEEISSSLKKTLLSVYNSLPEGAGVKYIGFMTQRSEPAIRICINGLGKKVFPYLRQLRCFDNLDDMRDLVRRLQRREDPESDQPNMRLLHLDVWGEVKPRFGLEFVFDRDNHVRGHFKEKSWLDRLVECGLCTRSKREALCNWPGYWRGHLTRKVDPDFAIRYTNHVKVVSNVTGFSAKGYLLFQLSSLPKVK